MLLRRKDWEKSCTTLLAAIRLNDSNKIRDGRELIF